MMRLSLSKGLDHSTFESKYVRIYPENSITSRLVKGKEEKECDVSSFAGDREPFIPSVGLLPELHTHKKRGRYMGRMPSLLSMKAQMTKTTSDDLDRKEKMPRCKMCMARQVLNQLDFDQRLSY